jgi:hypothetical protein
MVSFGPVDPYSRCAIGGGGRAEGGGAAHVAHHKSTPRKRFFTLSLTALHRNMGSIYKGLFVASVSRPRAACSAYPLSISPLNTCPSRQLLTSNICRGARPCDTHSVPYRCSYTTYILMDYGTTTPRGNGVALWPGGDGGGGGGADVPPSWSLAAPFAYLPSRPFNVTVFSISNRTDIYRVSWTNVRSYCRKWGYRYLPLHPPAGGAGGAAKATRHPNWIKVPLALDLLRRYTGPPALYVWMDDDMVITNPGVNLRELLADFIAAPHKLVALGADTVTPLGRQGLNAGIVVFQTGAETARFLEKWYNNALPAEYWKTEYLGADLIPTPARVRPGPHRSGAPAARQGVQPLTFLSE